MSDKTDLATASPSALVPAGGQTQVERMFELVVGAATNPDVDPGKMTALVDLQIRMMDYQKSEEFAKAKVAALMEMPTITKRGAIKNGRGEVQSRYSKFEDIQAVVSPILFRHGLVINFEVGQAGNQVTVRPVLTHRNGYVEKGEAMPLAVDTTGSKNATQGAGSAASYGKRHAMVAALNLRIDGDDDDGRGAGRIAPRPAHETNLINAAQESASKGAAAYTAWFQSLTTAEKGWLAFSGEHERLKVESVRAGE